MSYMYALESDSLPDYWWMHARWILLFCVVWAVIPGWICREPRNWRRWSSGRDCGIRLDSEQTGMPLCEGVVDWGMCNHCICRLVCCSGHDSLEGSWSRSTCWWLVGVERQDGQIYIVKKSESKKIKSSVQKWNSRLDVCLFKGRNSPCWREEVAKSVEKRRGSRQKRNGWRRKIKTTNRQERKET
jgi:hypothetical protein